MDEFLNWLRNNIKLVVLSLLGVVVFSVIIGLIIGMVSKSKKSYDKELYKHLAELKNAEKRQEEIIKNRNLSTFLIPPQVDINLKSIFETEYKDDLSYLLDNIKLRPIRITDLIDERTMGESTSIKAVIFDNEEKNIITIKDEIAEP